MTRHSLMGALLLWWMCAPLAVAQESTAPADTAIPDSRLFQRSDLYVLGGFAAATVAMLPLDRYLASRVRTQRLLESRMLNRIEQTLDFLGGPAPLIIGSTMYLVGRFGNVPRAAHLALHTTEAIVVGIVTSGALKTALGRARPYETADTNPRDFALGRGFKGSPWQSFPSGHSTISFAVAAAVTVETSEWWPQSKWIIGPLLFGGATLTGVSRMYDDKHWASDIVMGAAVGTFAGLKTVRFNHTRTGNRLDRWLLRDGGNESAELRLRVTPGLDGSLRFGADARW